MPFAITTLIFGVNTKFAMTERGTAFITGHKYNTYIIAVEIEGFISDFASICIHFIDKSKVLIKIYRSSSFMHLTIAAQSF